MFAAKFVGTIVEGSNYEAAITKGFTVIQSVLFARLHTDSCIQAVLPRFVLDTLAQVPG